MAINKILIIGYGFVGKYMKTIFYSSDLFDIQFGLKLNSGKIIEYDSVYSYLQKNEIIWDLAIICVPTPALKSGKCDVSEVSKSIEFWNPWIRNFLIKSTVEVGTTKKLREKYKIPIVFSPEYIGETPNHPMSHLDIKDQFLILGGAKEDFEPVFDIYKEYIPIEVKIYKTDPDTAELCKYMVNSYLALKVLFCNEFYDIAEKLGINYDELHDIWLADPRIGNSHTLVFKNNRGYGGKCFPKDVASINHTTKENNYSSDLLNFIINRNKYFKQKNKTN